MGVLTATFLNHRRILLWAFVGMLTALILFLMPAVPTLAGQASLRQTTIQDFNKGTMYHTGLSRDTKGGGDGDGEIRLLTIGISSANWKSDGNTTNLPTLQAHAAAQNKNRIYVSGGQSTLSTLGGTLGVYYATTLTSTTHNVSDWLSTTPLPAVRKAHAMVVVRDTLYVIGGLENTTAQSTVWFAPIGSNGSVGTWITTAALPQPRYDFAATVVNDTIYVIGGADNSGTAQSTVYYAKPNLNGTISNWLTATQGLPNPVAQHTGTSSGGAVYVIGGTDGFTWYPNTFYAIPAVNGDITTWTTTTDLQQNLVLATAVSFGGQLYTAGGGAQNNTILTNTIASNLVQTDGSLLPGHWVNSDVLSSSRQRAAAVVSDDGWIYVIEGNSGINGLNPLGTIDYGPTAAAGATRYAPSGNFTSSIIDVTGNYNILSMDWNATVSSTVSMTLQYRLGNSPDLSSAPWSSPFYAFQNGASPFTNTINISQTARYIQYRANLSSTLDDQSPVLNLVQVNYELPPDLRVAGMNMPPIASTTIVQNVTVFITNAVGAGFLSRPISSPTSASSPISRQSPRAINAPSAFTFTYVDLYIDPPTPPSSLNVRSLGNCYGFLASTMAPGSLVPVSIDHQANGTGGGCPILAGKHTFYVQVDTCDYSQATSICYDPTQNVYGYVQELLEDNNVGGPYYSGYRTQLPIIFR